MDNKNTGKLRISKNLILDILGLPEDTIIASCEVSKSNPQLIEFIVLHDDILQSEEHEIKLVGVNHGACYKDCGCVDVAFLGWQQGE